MARLFRRIIARVRDRWSTAVLRAFRLTGAAVAASVVAGLLLQDTVPVIAALTALLVVEVTLFDIVTSGVQRVVSVVVGVLLAVGFASRALRRLADHPPFGSMSSAQSGW